MTTQTGSPIGSIGPVTPAPSILTVARPLAERGSDGAMHEITYDRWRTGVSWAPIPCQPSYNWARCNARQLAPMILDPGDRSEDGYLLKQAPEDSELASVDSFVIYTPLECSSYIETGALDDDARALEEAHTPWGIARALWLGEGLPETNPTLRNTATDVTDLAGDTLQQGIAALLWAYEQATGGQGGATLHIPSELIVAAGSQWLVRQEGSGLLRGPLNSLVSPGPGYPLGESDAGEDGFGPGSSSDGFLGSGAGDAWLYVSGPVEVAVGPTRILPERVEERRDWYRRNDYHVWAERPAIVRFDPCPVFAVKVVNPAEPSVSP